MLRNRAKVEALHPFDTLAVPMGP